MVFVPWKDYGICPFYMMKRCTVGGRCQWSHPHEAERKRLWDYHTARQKEDWEMRGIPMLANPYNEKKGERNLGANDEGEERVGGVVPVGPVEKSKERRFLDWSVSPENEVSGVQAAASGVAAPALSRRTSPEKAQEEPQDRLQRRDDDGDMEMLASENDGESLHILDEDFPVCDTYDGGGVRVENEWEQMAPRPVPSLHPADLRTRASTTTSTSLLKYTLGATHHAEMGAKRMANGETKPVGPHPSTIKVSKQYLSQAAVESRLQPPTSNGEMNLQERSVAEAREDTMRLQGVTWIDTVRRALSLPIRTYATACIYYHKFRLANPGILNNMEYGNAMADACAASLLTACKVEDTLKKSRDVLAAAYNLKASGHDQLGSDDPLFETPSRAVIGLERMVLEAGGFDFRSKNPHKLFFKIALSIPEGRDEERDKVEKVGWTIMTDMFRTFAPLKQTNATMALAGLELAAHLVATSSPENVSAIRDELRQYDLKKWSTTREEIMETLLDMLDLYTQHTAHTILGTQYSLDDFLRIRLAFNKECNENNLPRFTHPSPSDRAAASNGSTLQLANGHPTPVSPPQPESQAQAQPTQLEYPALPEGGGTLRFMLNPQLAADEKADVQKYFVEEWEEYEEEIEVPLPRTQRPPSRDERRDPAGRGTPTYADIVREDREPPPRDRDRDRLRERDREMERDRVRVRERERDRRFDDRREYDRRYDDRRGRGYDERRFDDGRRRRP